MTSTSYYFADNIDFDMDAVFLSDVESEMEGWVTLFASPDQGSLKVAPSTPRNAPSLVFTLERGTSKALPVKASGWGSIIAELEQGFRNCEKCMVRKSPSSLKCFSSEFQKKGSKSP